jgi:agmatine deiminase
MMGTAKVVSAQAQEAVEKDGTWFMPDESRKHRLTWMAFGAQEKIWDDYLPHVRANVALIAKTIARYEPVSMLVRPDERRLAEQMCGEKIQLVETALDDIWLRDNGPTFVINQAGNLGAVDLNFNGWGKKQFCDKDAAVAQFIAQQAGAEYITSKLVGEGGGIEVDGRGTAIITESCIINRNRNPGLSKADCEKLLKTLLGLRKIIWLPGIRGKDITDGHTDWYARFARPGVVVAGLETNHQSYDYEVTREHLTILKAARNADGNKLEVVTLESPSRNRPKLETEEFAAGYINYYVVNGAVIAPEFGDMRTDSKCKEVLQALFPKRDVVQLNIDAVAAGGGGIHCVTQQEPYPAA